MSAIIAARLCADEQLLVTVCEQMVSRVRGVSADVDAVGELAGKRLRRDAVPMDELVLLEDEPETGNSIRMLI